jgi:hypothetical protein
MGVECDGATYHSAKSARDRDRLRQSILERLGWNIRRIWSTDWFKNPKAELEPIVRELNRIKSVAPAVVHDEVGVVEETEEVEEIEEIVREADEQEEQRSFFVLEEGDLRDKLIQFDREVVRKNRPQTKENKRLLRPAMIEALLEFVPTSKAEFLELIPSYIRSPTDPNEGEYLPQVFDIINASLEETLIVEE